MAVFHTVTIPCYRYTVPHFGIPYFCGIPNCDMAFRYTVIPCFAVRHTVIPLYREKIYYIQNIKKKSCFQLLQKIGFPIFILLFLYNKNSYFLKLSLNITYINIYLYIIYINRYTGIPRYTAVWEI